METQDRVTALENNWATDERWQGTRRDYSAQDVARLRGSVEIKHTLAELGAGRLWDLLHKELEVHRTSRPKEKCAT
ncbi:MAG: hypothetical protein ACR2HX_10285 [Pyrinomonadaceae bacterium]